MPLSVTSRSTISPGGQLIDYKEKGIHITASRMGVDIHASACNTREQIQILQRLLQRAWLAHKRIKNMSGNAALPLEEC